MGTKRKVENLFPSISESLLRCLSTYFWGEKKKKSKKNCKHAKFPNLIAKTTSKGGHGPEFLLASRAGLFHFMYGPGRASPRAQILRAKI